MPTLRVHYYLFQTIILLFFFFQCFYYMLLHIVMCGGVLWMCVLYFVQPKRMGKLCKKNTHKKKLRRKRNIYFYTWLWKIKRAKSEYEQYELHDCLCANIVCTRKSFGINRIVSKRRRRKKYCIQFCALIAVDFVWRGAAIIPLCLHANNPLTDDVIVETQLFVAHY